LSPALFKIVLPGLCDNDQRRFQNHYAERRFRRNDVVRRPAELSVFADP
jgi:hypothetical protein